MCPPSICPTVMRLNLPEAVCGMPWTSQLWRRFWLLWPLKCVGTILFMVLFFWGYFAVLDYPLREAVTIPTTLLDAWVPFSPLAFPVYVSLWIYVSLPPALFGSLRALLWFGVWIAALCIFCLAVFWLFPTVVPIADIDWDRYPHMAVIRGVDAGGNAFPSLHVASSVFTAYWLAYLLKAVGAPRGLYHASWVMCLLIVWSTVATRQHVVLDVVAGAVVGFLFAWMSLRHVRRSCRASVV